MTELRSAAAPPPGDAARDPLRRGLSLVRRRLFINRFLSVLFLDLFVILCVFGSYVLVHRLVHPAVDPLLVLGLLAGVGLSASLIRAIVTARSTWLQAALLVDERLQLKERVSTAICLRSRPLAPPETPGDGTAELLAGWRDLVERDGRRALEAAPVARHFPVHLPGVARWTFAPLAACVLIALLVPQMDLLGLYSARLANAAFEEEVDRSAEQASERLEELALAAEREVEDPELKRVLEALKNELEKTPPEESVSPSGTEEESGGEARKKQSLVKFSRLEDLLKENLQRSEFKKLEDFLARNKLNRLDPDALTRKLQEALKKGEFDKARDEIKKLEDELAALRRKKEPSPEELERLKKLAEELQQLARSASALGQLGKSLGGLAGGLSGGNLDQALAGLESLDIDLKELAELMKQMQYLDRSLELVKLTKQDLAKLHRCPNCGKLRKGPVQPGGT